MKKFREIFNLVKGYRAELLSNFVFNVLNAIFSLFTFFSVVPFLYILFRVEKESASTDSGVMNSLSTWLNKFIAEHGQMQTLALMCGVIVILALLKNLVNYLSLLSIAKIRTAVSRDMRTALYKKILDLPVAFFSNERKGDLISRMTQRSDGDRVLRDWRGGGIAKITSDDLFFRL